MEKKVIYFNSLSNKISCHIYHKSSNKEVLFILPGDSNSGVNSSSYSLLIEKAIIQGISIVGVNFNSQAESEGERKNLLLSNSTQNFEDAFEYINSEYKKQFEKFYILGSSFGASVFANSNLVDNFHKVVFKSPAVSLTEAYENDEGGLAEILQWKKDVVSKNSGLDFRAYEEAINFNFYSKLYNKKIEMLTIIGSADEIVNIDTAKRFALLSDSEFTILKGVTHSYKTNNGIELFTNNTLNFLK
jgi:hypothetical protein